MTDAELVTLAVAQALLGIRSEARWLRLLPRHLPGAFRYLPRQSVECGRCTPAGLPVTWALANPKLDERQVLMAILEHDPTVLADRPGLLIIADKGYVSRELDVFLTERGVRLLRPSYRNRTPHLLKPVRQLIESVNDTLKGQLDLELHAHAPIDGVTARIAQRILAMTAAIWHNRAPGQPTTRSLIAYDH